MTRDLRTEYDLLGVCQVPKDAYHGIHTQRAVGNFAITGSPISIFPHFIAALASIKEAATASNLRLGLLDVKRAHAIISACRDVRAGMLDSHFQVDVIQGGAGTSSNMNANEVIANRALEILGYEKGSYSNLHPNEHVNMSQSTNDVYPTALKIAAFNNVLDLLDAMDILRLSFERKAEEFSDVIKMGRTQLQDAVPMTLGQEFLSYAIMLGEDQERLREAALLLHEINMGGTAIGTGINSHPDYARLVCFNLSEITGLPLKTAPNLIEATQDCGVFVHLSGVLKRIAVKISKVCNDLRLLSSGPRTGFNEITLPAVQAGSSIMPGKINPVIPEVVNQVAFEVIGNDLTITFAAEGGQLQLNAFEPIIAYSLFKSIDHLRAAFLTLESRCINGITANREHLKSNVENSIGLATALNSYIGYQAASALAVEALSSGKGIAELVLEHRLLPAQKLAEILMPEALTKPQRVAPDT